MALDTQQSPATIDSQAAIGFLIASNGNAKLAAMRASVASGDPSGNAISEAALLMAIAQDPNAIGYLRSQIDVMVLVQTLDAYRLTHMAFVQQLPKLSARDLAQTYTRLLQNLSTHMATPLQGGASNTLDTALNALPPKVAEAVRFFIDNPAAGEGLPTSAANDSGSDNINYPPTPTPNSQHAAPPNQGRVTIPLAGTKELDLTGFSDQQIADIERLMAEAGDDVE